MEISIATFIRRRGRSMNGNIKISEVVFVRRCVDSGYSVREEAGILVLRVR